MPRPANPIHSATTKNSSVHDTNRATDTAALVPSANGLPIVFAALGLPVPYATVVVRVVVVVLVTVNRSVVVLLVVSSAVLVKVVAVLAVEVEKVATPDGSVRVDSPAASVVVVVMCPVAPPPWTVKTVSVNVCVSVLVG